MATHAEGISARSWLFAPGDSERKMEKAIAGSADVVVFDLEDAVTEAVAGIEPGATRVMVLATEEPASMLAIGSYAGVPRVAAMSWGAEDLATALGASDNRGPDGDYDFTYQLARSLCLVGAAAAGVPAIETIHGDFRDEAGLRKRAAAMRRAGFGGMLAIHPAQVDVINEAFSPSAEELAAAQQIVDLFAANPGAGTIGHEGAMLDRPHLARAGAAARAAPR